MVLRQRDVEGLLLYHRFVRSKPPCKLQTTKFFFNTKGASLGKDVLFYVRTISRKAGLKSFTVNNLRKAMETENDLSANSVDKKIVSDHLGHVMHQSGSMIADGARARGSFMAKSNDIRDNLFFADPMQ